MMDEAEKAVGSASPEASGVLRVNVPVSFGVLHLAPVWADLMSAHSRLRWESAHLTSAAITTRV